MYDIIIIGAGPSGLTSAIYASHARKKILLLEKDVYGGQIVTADKVKNYPGFEEITGYDFATKLYNQAKSLNPEIKFEEAISIKNYENYKEVITKNSAYKTKTIIIATGARNRKLGIENEDKFIGKGISYCTACDGMMFKNKDVAIVGGGRSAINGALYLSDICNKVYFIYRQKDFKEDSIEIESLNQRNNVEFVFNSIVTSIIGDNRLVGVHIKEDSIEKDLNIDGLFVEIGNIPVSYMCNNIIDTDNRGYIIASENCTTNIEGIYTAGDVREKEIRQLTTATSDGTIAALNACKYLNKQKEV